MIWRVESEIIQLLFSREQILLGKQNMCMESQYNVEIPKAIEQELDQVLWTQSHNILLVLKSYTLGLSSEISVITLMCVYGMYD